MRVRRFSFNYSDLEKIPLQNIREINDIFYQINKTLEQSKEVIEGIKGYFVMNFGYLKISQDKETNDKLAFYRPIDYVSEISKEFVKENLPASFYDENIEKHNFMFYQFLEPKILLFKREKKPFYRYIKFVKENDIAKEASEHLSNLGTLFHFPVFIIYYKEKLTPNQDIKEFVNEEFSYLLKENEKIVRISFGPTIRVVPYRLLSKGKYRIKVYPNQEEERRVNKC